MSGTLTTIFRKITINFSPCLMHWLDNNNIVYLNIKNGDFSHLTSRYELC